MARLGHVIGWTVLGAIVGFTYGWWRMRASSERARAVIDSAPTADPAARRYALGQQQGYRLAAASYGAMLGVLIGLAIGVLSAGLAALFGIPIW